MTKILYDFENIGISLENLNGTLKSINTLESSVNSLSVDIVELSSSLTNAKKTTLQNIKNIVDDLTLNINKVKNLCDAYQEYESSKVSSDTLLNKEFPTKEIVSSINYKIKYGDTLTSIAKKQNVTIDAIVEANKDKIKNKNLIYAGDNIVIPVVNNVVNEGNIKELSSTEGQVFKASSEKDLDDVKGSGNTKNITDINLSSTYYNSNLSAGFSVTFNNKKYSLTADEKDLLYAIVSAECDKSPDDALAVVSTILNRCEDTAWINSHGTNPISQATAPNQFVVYQEGYYKNYTNGKAPDAVKNAVNDALNGVRNCSYLSFRSNSSIGYSNNMISSTGNRYK